MDRRNARALEIAYAVPFTLKREPSRGLYRITNHGPESVHGVAFTLHGGGLVGANAPVRLDPLESLEVTVAGRNLARDSILVVRWFRPDGTEYLWRISF